MFAAIFMPPLYAILVIIVLVAVCGNETRITSVAYGHLAIMNLSTLSWGMLPCMMFYGASSFPYLFVRGNTWLGSPLPLENLVALLILEGFFYYASSVKLFESVLSHSTYLVAILLCSYGHKGPFGWLVYIEDMSPGDVTVWMMLEAMLPLLVCILLRLVFGHEDNKKHI